MTVEALGGALTTYRRTASSRSAILLIAANVLPLVGVLFFGWSLLTILVLYWIENGIVGLWNLPRIALAQGSMIPLAPQEPPWASLASIEDPAQAATIRKAWQQAQAAQVEALKYRASAMPASFVSAGRVALAAFFLIHYGIFWLVHGIFIFALPAFMSPSTALTFGGCGEADPFGRLQPCGGSFGEVAWSSIGIAAIALFISHGASFFLNYIGRGEYVTASPTRQMAAPYARVVVLHLTIIFGAFVVAILGAPIGALLVLVILKTAFDLGLHLREHRAARITVPPGVAGPA
jgi:Family of unknown function (DUF6498)